MRIEIEGDPRIKELYAIDYKVFLRLKALDSLQRKESAQALYTYLASLPKNPAPISMKRFRDRLRLTSRVSAQNEIIRRSLHELHEIGYLQYHEEKVGRNIKFHILKEAHLSVRKRNLFWHPRKMPRSWMTRCWKKLKMMKAAGFYRRRDCCSSCFHR